MSGSRRDCVERGKRRDTIDSNIVETVFATNNTRRVIGKRIREVWAIEPRMRRSRHNERAEASGYRRATVPVADFSDRYVSFPVGNRVDACYPWERAWPYNCPLPSFQKPSPRILSSESGESGFSSGTPRFRARTTGIL